jgi:hypothetical protein
MPPNPPPQNRRNLRRVKTPFLGPLFTSTLDHKVDHPVQSRHRKLERKAQSRYPSAVDETGLKAAVKRISSEKDPLAKHLLAAAVCSRIFASRSVELIVVGGSAIEFYTDGAYLSGDVDLCVATAKGALTLRDRQELMGMLEAKGGPRSWQVAGVYVDILGVFESNSKSPPRRLKTELGEVAIAPPEELAVERILVSVYPSKYPPARACAEKLIAAGLRNEFEMDWKELRRIAKLREYQNETDVVQIVEAEAKALALGSPYDSQG